MTGDFRKLVESARARKRTGRVRSGVLLAGLTASPRNWGQKDPNVPLEQSATPQHLDPPRPPTDRISVERELSLLDTYDRGKLAEIRREFAKANHPDAHPQLRSDYEQRMKLANQIIDERLQQIT